MRQSHQIDPKKTEKIKGNKLLSIAVGSLFLLSLPILATAQTQFEGSLNSVSITDAGAINTPPIVEFTYSINGDIVTFDATETKDPDGTIAQYTWNFGDNSTGNGMIISHQFNSTDNAEVTLTVLDNANGVSIGYKFIPFSSCTESSSLYSVQNANSQSIGIYGSTGVGGIFKNDSGQESLLSSITINLFESNADETEFTFHIYDLSAYLANNSVAPVYEQKIKIPAETGDLQIDLSSPLNFPSGEDYFWAILGEDVTWGNRIRTGNISTNVAFKNTMYTTTGWQGFKQAGSINDWSGEISICVQQ